MKKSKRAKDEEVNGQGRKKEGKGDTPAPYRAKIMLFNNTKLNSA